MKIFKNWFVISLIASVVLMLLSLLFWGNWYLSVFIGIVVFILVLRINPKLRYIRAFGAVFSAFLVLNGHFFEIKGSIGGLEFALGSHTIDRWVSVALIVVMALLLVLDYMVRSGKQKNKILIKIPSSKISYISISIALLIVIIIGFVDKIDVRNTEIIGSVIQEVDSVGNINSVKVEGNGNITIIYNGGGTTTKSFEEFMTPFIKKNKNQIIRLESQLKDKERIIGYQDKDILRISSELNELQEKLKETEQNARHILEQYNGKDLSQESDLYKKAFALFIDGELDKALEVLDDVELEKMAQEASKPFILKAQTLRLKHKYKEAGSYYKRAIQIAPTFDNYFQAACFFQFINSFSKAEKYYTKALLLTKADDKRAQTLNNLGILQRDLKDYSESLKNYKESLSILRTLAESNPSSYLPDVATSLNNLGVLQRDLKDYSESLKNYSESLSIRRTLAESNPSSYLPDVAMTLINMSGLYVYDSNKELSLRYVNEALEYLYPLKEEAFAQNYLEVSYSILKYWDIEPEEYIASKTIVE